MARGSTLPLEVLDAEKALTRYMVRKWRPVWFGESSAGHVRIISGDKVVVEFDWDDIREASDNATYSLVRTLFELLTRQSSIAEQAIVFAHRDLARLREKRALAAKGARARQAAAREAAKQGNRRKDIILKYLKDHADWSNSRIAKRCGCSHNYVSQVRSGKR